MLSFAELHEKHRLELENLTLTTQPFKTFKFFIFASALYMKRSIHYIVTKGVWLTILITSFLFLGLLLMAAGGPHEKVLASAISYYRVICKCQTPQPLSKFSFACMMVTSQTWMLTLAGLFDENFICLKLPIKFVMITYAHLLVFMHV